jgi:alkylation response protein AidB-like acyl-CoA dehydrogenase
MNEDELRQRVRDLLEKIHPDDPKIDRTTFRRAQYEAGLAWVHFPEGLGGLGLQPKDQAIVHDELRRNAKTFYQDLLINPIGIGICAPVLVTHAPEDLTRELLPRIFTAEDIWCQMFSEPSAGSDLAALGTRAVRDGDEWVISGQKVWTTYAHIARWGTLLARTDPDLPKHDGLSYFIVDMKSPGVVVRPLYQLTGEAEFNEVFFNEVRVPQSHMLGREGQGWRVAITTLMNERRALGAGSRKKGGAIGTLVKLWQARAKQAFASPSSPRLRDRVVELYVESELLRLTNQRARAAQRSGNPGPEGSVGKLAQAEINQRIWECGMEILGDDALVYEPGYALHRPDDTVARTPDHDGEDPSIFVKYQYLRSRANTIEGGTSEIMRNILGERILGLPGEPRVDADMPWKDIPRN